MKAQTRTFIAFALLLLLASDLVVVNAKAIKIGTTSRLHPLVAQARVAENMNSAEVLEYLRHLTEKQNVLLETASKTGAIPLFIMVALTIAQMVLDTISFFWIRSMKKKIINEIINHEKEISETCLVMRSLKDISVQQFFRSNIAIKASIDMLLNNSGNDEEKAAAEKFQQLSSQMEDVQQQIMQFLDTAIQRECEFVGEMALQLSAFVKTLNDKMESLKKEIALSAVALAISGGLPVSSVTTIGANIALSLLSDEVFDNSNFYRAGKVGTKLGAGLPTILLEATGHTAASAIWLTSCQSVAAAYAFIIFAQSCVRLYDTIQLSSETETRLAEQRLLAAQRRAGQCSLLLEANRNQIIQHDSSIAILNDLEATLKKHPEKALPYHEWSQPWARHVTEFCTKYSPNTCARLLRPVGQSTILDSGVSGEDLTNMARSIKYGPITDLSYSETLAQAATLHSLGFTPVFWEDVERKEGEKVTEESVSHQAVWVCRACSKNYISDVMYTDRQNLPSACKTVCGGASTPQEQEQCAAQCHSVPAGNGRYLVYVRPLQTADMHLERFAMPRAESSLSVDAEAQDQHEHTGVLTDLFVEGKMKLNQGQFQERESVMAFSNFQPITAVTTLKRAWHQHVRDWFINKWERNPAGTINPGTSVTKTSFFASFKPLSYRWEERSINTDKIFFMVTMGHTCRAAGDIPVTAGSLPWGFNPSLRLVSHRLDEEKRTWMTWITTVDPADFSLPLDCRSYSIGRTAPHHLLNQNLALLDIHAFHHSEATKGQFFEKLGYTKIPLEGTETTLLVRTLFPEGDDANVPNEVTTHEVAHSLREVAKDLQQQQHKISSTYNDLLCSGSCHFEDDDPADLLPATELKFPTSPAESLEMVIGVSPVTDALMKPLIKQHYKPRESKPSELKLKGGHVSHVFFKLTGADVCTKEHRGSLIVARRGTDETIVPFCSTDPLPDGFSSDGQPVEEIILEVILSEARKGGMFGKWLESKEKNGIEELQNDLKLTDTLRAAVENGYVAFKPHEAVFDERMPNRDFFGELSLEGYRTDDGTRHAGVIALFRFWLKKDLRLQASRRHVCSDSRDSGESEVTLLLDGIKKLSV